MKVLWITNTLFPAVCRELNISTPVVGGWMYSSAEALLRDNGNIELGVAAPYHGDQLRASTINGIDYFLLPQPRKRSLQTRYLHPYWKQVKEQFSPDIVHIHGSEYPHGLSYVEACGKEHVVLSIQGMVSIIERYYIGGVSERELSKHVTLRDIVKKDSIFKQREWMRQRGELERKLIKQISHVIGRTKWDEAHIWAINTNSKYHHCDETLREVFYTEKWEHGRCEKYSIFLSQAHYPIKGLHQMIKALPFIIKIFPETKVYVAGHNFVDKQAWRLNGYAKYIRSLIRKYNLSDKIIFTGLLPGTEMCQRYVKSHVFVCPSSIENSPNSVGEAQLLGVPCVASYVGGTMDMVQHEENGLLYRFEEVEMLARSVCRIFEDESLAKRLSKNSRQAASLRHNRDLNAKQLNSIYELICQ